MIVEVLILGFKKGQIIEYDFPKKQDSGVIYGKPLHSVSEKWNEWKPTKKVYWSMSAAKLGIKNLPSDIDRDRITIIPYGPKSII